MHWVEECKSIKMTAFFGFENLWLDVEPHFNICLNVKLNFVCVNSDIDRRKVHKIPSPNQIDHQTMLSNKQCLKNQPKLKFFFAQKASNKINLKNMSKRDEQFPNTDVVRRPLCNTFVHF